MAKLHNIGNLSLKTLSQLEHVIGGMKNLQDLKFKPHATEEHALDNYGVPLHTRVVHSSGEFAFRG